MSIARELAGGDRHQYSIELAAGQHISFRIEKQGIILSLTLNGPDGGSLFSGNVEAHEQGEETLSLVARAPGKHTLVISPQFEKASPGRYKLMADELRAATEEDRRRFAAQQLVAEGDRLFEQRTKDTWLESSKKLSKALDIWRALGDRDAAAGTLQRMGLGRMWLREYEAAHAHLNEALELSRATGDKAAEAETLRAIGMVYAAEVKNQEALKYLDEAEALQKGLAERWQTAVTSVELAKLHWRLGRREQVRNHFADALRGMGEVGDIVNEAGTRTSFSFILLSEGDYQSALDNLLPALELFRAAGNEYGAAFALNTLGAIYYNLGEPRKALDYFRQAAAIGDQRVELEYGASALTNLGITYATLDKKEQALAHFNEALKRMRKSNDPRGVSLTLRRIGKLYREMGDLPRALEYLNESLGLTREQGDPAGEADALTSIAEAHADAGERAKALEELGHALPLMQSVRDRHGEAATLYALATVDRDRGELLKARAHIEKAIEIIESLRAKVTGVELRTSYLAAHQNYYELYIDLLMRLHEQSPAAGYDEAALQASERARARALLESLAEARADIRQGVSPELLERERSLARQLNAKDERRLRLNSVKPKPPEAEAADREVEALLDQFKLAQAQIRAASPRYAALTQPQPLDLKHIRAQLDDKTLLLIYSLGRERSFLFAVIPSAVKSFVLPKRQLIEAEAQRVYKRVKEDAVETSATGGKVSVMDRAGMKDRRLLSQWLLGPVASQLASKRLVVVADGKLQYVPFAALTEPGTTRPLVLGHELVTLPSLSVLDQLHRDLAARPAAPKSVAVIADPVYSLDDERFKGVMTKQGSAANGGSAQSGPLASVNHAFRESGLEELQKRLPGSRREADQITSLFPPATYAKIMGFEASRATLAQTDLSQYRILHFATHGLLNSQNPELSGVVLSLYDEGGRAQDGLLRAHEIYNLKLGADLVVLSACQTALGKEVRGEGLIGLARGFIYAGSPRIVVSLWKVDDDATAEMMRRFYEGMVRRNLPPAAALREAQAAMARGRDWSSPYNWAGFVLQGEWR